MRLKPGLVKKSKQIIRQKKMLRTSETERESRFAASQTLHLSDPIELSLLKPVCLIRACESVEVLSDPQISHRYDYRSTNDLFNGHMETKIAIPTLPGCTRNSHSQNCRPESTGFIANYRNFSSPGLMTERRPPSLRILTHSKALSWGSSSMSSR